MVNMASSSLRCVCVCVCVCVRNNHLTEEPSNEKRMQHLERDRELLPHVLETSSEKRKPLRDKCKETKEEATYLQF